MPLLFQKMIYREDLQANSDVYYVFGDNDERIGLAGQAGQMRGEPNAIGIRTKKSPNNNPNAFYTDKEYRENHQKITEDFDKVLDLVIVGETVIWPLDGVGTGLADLKQKAPRTMDYIIRRLQALKEHAKTKRSQP